MRGGVGHTDNKLRVAVFVTLAIGLVPSRYGSLRPSFAKVYSTSCAGRYSRATGAASIAVIMH